MQFKPKLLYIALGGFLLLSGLAELPDAQGQAPTTAQIIFNSKEGRRWEIFVVEADGKNVRRLMNNLATFHYFSPTWSPNGKQIAYTINMVGAGNIYVMDTDGRNRHRVTDYRAPARGEFEKPPMTLYGASGPAWSPDGKQIAFTRHLRPHVLVYEIFVIDADGRNAHELTNLGHQATSPTWSPDGKQIAFSSNHSDKNYDIYIMDADGRNVRLLTTLPERDHDPAWSPDGRRIVFSSRRGEETDLYVVDVNGQNRRKLTGGRSPAFCGRGIFSMGFP